MIHQEISDGIRFRQGGHASHRLGIRQVTDENTNEDVTFEADEPVTIQADEAVVVIVEVDEAVIVIVEVNKAVMVVVILPIPMRPPWSS